MLDVGSVWETVETLGKPRRPSLHRFADSPMSGQVLGGSEPVIQNQSSYRRCETLAFGGGSS